MRRVSANPRLPEPLGSTIRQRLVQLRLLRDKKTTQIATMSMSTLNNYENHDISSIGLGRLVAYAEELGMAFPDFIHYLWGGYSTTRDDNEIRLLSLFQVLPPDLQSLACHLVQQLVSHHASERAAHDPSNGRVSPQPERLRSRSAPPAAVAH